MATRKMTFTFPEDVAARFARRVPANQRSRYVCDAVMARLAEQEQQLIAACEAANADPDVSAIELEFDALPDTVAEPWTADAPASR